MIRRMKLHFVALLGFTAVSFLVLTSATEAQVDPLSFAAAGVSTSLALDKAEQTANNLIQQSGNVASLTSSKIARDLQMLISDARQQLHEELTDNWDTLDRQKVDLLRSIDVYIKQLNGVMAKGGLLEEDAYLDLTQLTQKLPFASSDPILRSVRGATISYRETGLYHVTLRGTIFDPSNGPLGIKLGNTPVSADVKIAYTPPYEAAIDFPASYLSHYFNETALAYIPVNLSVLVPDKSYYFYNLRKKTRPAIYTFTLQLLPKHPITKYSLIELNAEPTVDRNVVSRTWGAISQVPGCGHDDCNSGQLVCADVPVGGEPIGIVDHYDDLMSAWGEFVGPPIITPTSVCQAFHQHRPASRNVKIEISYYPPDTKLVANDVRFQEVSADDSAAKPIPPATELGFDQLYVAYFNKKMQSFRLGMTLFTGEPLGSTPSQISSPLLQVSKMDQSKDREITIQIKPPW
jgi:hypothetical protein